MATAARVVREVLGPRGQGERRLVGGGAVGSYRQPRSATKAGRSNPLVGQPFVEPASSPRTK